MNEQDVNMVIEKLKSGELGYEQLYNLDLEIAQHAAIEYYKTHQNDSININQLLHILFLDIEVYSYGKMEFKPDQAKSPIVAFTFYSTKTKTYHIFCMTLPINANKFTTHMVPAIEEQFTNELRNKKYKDAKGQECQYLENDETIKIHLYNGSELSMLLDCWTLIHELDPAVLSGAYSDMFDIPYIFNRLKALHDGDEKRAAQIMSKFGVVKIRKMGIKGTSYQIADYPTLDIVHLYKPRGEGGLIH